MKNLRLAVSRISLVRLIMLGLIMLVVGATIVPGAVIGWLCREDLSIGKWLVMAVPYWLIVGAISALGVFLMRKARLR